MTFGAPGSHRGSAEPGSSESARLGTRIRAVFASPARLPGLLSPDFPWLDVLLISTAVAVVANLFVPDEAYLEPMRAAVTRRGEPVEISSSPEVIASWGRWMGMLATLATHPVVAMVLAGGLTLVFTTFFRGPATFRAFLSLASHGLLIPALGTLLSIVVLTVAPGIWLPTLALGLGDGSSFLLAALAAVDLFVVWMLIALAFSVHTVDPRRSRLQAATILVGAYLALAAASAALLHPELIRMG